MKLVVIFFFLNFFLNCFFSEIKTPVCLNRFKLKTFYSSCFMCVCVLCMLYDACTKWIERERERERERVCFVLKNKEINKNKCEGWLIEFQKQ
jgi:hypothetical protein